MATNLYLCYPDAQLTASTITAPTAQDTSVSFSNTLSGDRQEIYKSDAQATSRNFDYDMGSGGDISPDYFIIARADLIRNADSADCTITLRGSASGGYTSPEDEALMLGSSTLFGPYAEDTILETTYSTDYRYWRLIVATTQSVVCQFSKLYFGNWLDLGRDPEYVSRIRKEWKGKNVRKLKRTVTLRWRGITEAKRIAFDEKVATKSDIHPLFLYDKGDNLLDGVKLLHVRMTSHVWDLQTYGTTLTASFEEVL